MADDRSKRVLVVSSYLPYPQDNGDALRVLGMFRALESLNLSVTVAVVRRADTTDDDVQHLRDALPVTEVLVYDLASDAGSMRPAARLSRLWRALRHRHPPLLLTPFSQTLADDVGRLTEAADMTILIGEPAGLYANISRSPRVVWDKANVLTGHMVGSLGRNNAARTRLWALLNLVPAYLFERTTIRRVTDVWVTTAEELQRYERYFRRSASGVLPSSIPSVKAATVVKPDASSRTLVWLSTFAYAPNWDGLCRLLEDGRQQFQQHGITLRVIGKGASPNQVGHLEKLDFVDYRGFQHDLAAACQGVTAAIVPIWAGAGLKLKTLQFMTMGVPVIATPDAMEGIPRDAALAVHPDVNSMLQSAVECSNEDLTVASHAGLDFVRNSGSEDMFRRRLATLLDVTDGAVSA